MTQATGLPIPPLKIPEEFREIATTQYFLIPLSALAYMVENSESESIKMSWPANHIGYLGHNIYVGMSCVEAYRLIPVSIIASILDTVRNRVLEFAIAIENEYPDAGEALINSPSVPPEYITYNFNTIIMGDIGNLSQGCSDIYHEVHQGDLESLKRYLSGIGISKSDLKELDASLIDDEKKRCLQENRNPHERMDR